MKEFMEVSSALSLALDESIFAVNHRKKEKKNIMTSIVMQTQMGFLVS